MVAPVQQVVPGDGEVLAEALRVGDAAAFELVDHVQKHEPQLEDGLLAVLTLVLHTRPDCSLNLLYAREHLDPTSPRQYPFFTFS